MGQIRTQKANCLIFEFIKSLAFYSIQLFLIFDPRAVRMYNEELLGKLSDFM